MSSETCNLPRPSRLYLLWSRAIDLAVWLWPEGAMPTHPCASRVTRDLARDLRYVPDHLRRDIGLDGGQGLSAILCPIGRFRAD
ncbi:hypothetical protein [uncultured Paracoccus sp.]|uniref:hypothetical protein n=1 Tax=uncultured Paracoccus sp. TaxID=189685 RepID=UPI00260676BB|nr:hypothetical protein [uncultured Paracoccus sp.]